MFDYHLGVSFNFQIFNPYFLGYVHSSNHSLVLDFIVCDGELEFYCCLALFPVGSFKNDPCSTVLSCRGPIHVCNPCFLWGSFFFLGYVSEFNYKVDNSMAFKWHPWVEFNVEFSELSGPIDKSTRETGFLKDFSQWALGKNFDDLSLKVQSQSSGGCYQGKS